MAESHRHTLTQMTRSIWKGKCLEYRTTQWTEAAPNRNSPVPFSCQSPGQGVLALYICKQTWFIISNIRETFANKQDTFEKSKKPFARDSRGFPASHVQSSQLKLFIKYIQAPLHRSITSLIGTSSLSLKAWTIPASYAWIQDAFSLYFCWLTLKCRQSNPITVVWSLLWVQSCYLKVLHRKGSRWPYWIPTLFF